ncbi:MAG: FkbM family methyltransferase [Planctomycetota bacterium]
MAATFVSYAQNFEDVMLSRALRDVDGGFWIDVGADDPDTLSVTRAFAERGWRGINVEPLPDRHARFVARRPRDTNACVLVGSAPGKRRFWRFGTVDSGCSTMDAIVAARHVRAGRRPTAEWDVDVTTVDALCDRHAPPDIHFLKVDVEGAEEEVFAGMALDHHRPWIIVAESVVPGSQDPSHAVWEPLLTGRGYSFVYGDGLNRFYLAAEHDDLRTAFATPPNVFDGFRLSGCRHQVGMAGRGKGWWRWLGRRSA